MLRKQLLRIELYLRCFVNNKNISVTQTPTVLGIKQPPKFFLGTQKTHLLLAGFELAVCNLQFAIVL